MNRNILRDDVQEFINENLKSDVAALALKKDPFKDVSSPELAGQILAKQKAEKKLPTWFNTKKIYYPRPLSVEQTSSEITAKYKASIIQGNTVLDITGGFGVDAYYFAKQCASVTHCEIDAELSTTASYNSQILDVENILFVNADGLDYLKDTAKHWDVIFIDPARRTNAGKVFKLEDCTPNILEHLPLLLNKAKIVVIKTSPLLDLNSGLLAFNHVKAIHAVSTKNECKELLWIIENDWQDKPTVFAVSLNKTDKKFKFLMGQISNISFSKQILKGIYLYEPDVAVLKAGAQDALAATYNLQKLAANTHLYSSTQLEPNFMGRIFVIENVIEAKELKKSAKLRANVIVRNYPAKAEDLIKKYSIKPAKDDFLIFCKSRDQENTIFAAKIIQYY